MSKNTSAVIGMGSIGKRHIKNLRFLYPEASIFAISASGSNTQLPEGATALIPLKDLIQHKPQFVIVASPSSYHIQHAEICINAGISTLVEKPLSHCSEEANHFLKICDAKKEVPVAVAYCLRFLPSALTVKKIIENNELGHVYHVSSSVGQFLPTWRSDKSYQNSVSAQSSLGGGVLLELSHELDYLAWLFGDLELAHSRLQKSAELNLEVEDLADLVLIAQDGAHISVHLDFIQKSPQRTCTIIGEKGRIDWDLVANTVVLHSKNGPETIYADPTYDKNTMYLDMLRIFINPSNQEAPQLASILSATKIVDLITEAKKKNSWRKQG